MESIASFQGLASGINFRDLVDGIIQAESRPITLLQQRKTALDRRQTAWGDVESRIQTLTDRSEDLADGALFRSFGTSVTGMTGGASAPLSVSANSSATPGSFSARVLQLATREKVSGDTYADRTAALGLTGEFMVGGKAVSVAATQSLADVAAAVNAANTGADPSGVSASVVGSTATGFRMVLTAAQSGSAGVRLADGSGGILAGLGFQDGTTSLRHATSDGAKSDGFTAATTAVGTLLGLSTPPASAAVTLGGVSVTVDLANDSLDDIASAINTAALGAGSAVTAAVVSETDADGDTIRRLDISGTTSFTDNGGILETLGVLEGGRGAVQHQVQGAAFTAGDAVTPATGATLLTDLWQGTSESVQVGDTLSIGGTRGDGSTFTKTFTVGAGSTYQDLVDAVNDGTDAFGAGSRTATASIDASGRLLVTDDTGGDSRLSLSIVANNEGGGTLDFGDFSTVAVGRAREITAGLDAEIEIDGAFYSRSGNTVSDVVDGVTLSLSEVSADVVTVDVTRDVDKVVNGITSFVKAYNAFSEYVNSQFTGAGAEEGSSRPALSGDATIRTMRSKLRAALETAIASSVTDVSRLGELGITLNREGTYDIDDAVLREAIEQNAASVERYFAQYGAGSTSSLEFVAAGEGAASGDYAVAITTAAAQGSVTGAGFGGTYVDDGTADTLTVTDADTGSEYDVSLTNGMTMAQVVDALNTEFSTSTTRTLEAANAVYSDALGTVADDTTVLADLHDGGATALGVADGDVITISGAKSDGTSVFREWTITDVTTQTLGDLKAQISSTLGSGVTLSFADGVLTAQATDPGRQSFTLAVTSDNAGGGTLDFGGVGVTEAGRGTVDITASDDGGQLRLSHTSYGAAAGFDVAYTGGGTDGSASLGLAAGSYRGIDVAGTIGGQAATGSGRVLEAADGTTAEGLMVRYTGTVTGAVGSMTFSRGIASLMEIAAQALLDDGDASIQGIVDRIDTQKQSLDNRIGDFEDRLARRADTLIKRFSELEEAMAKAQQQAAWLNAQLGSLTSSTK
ncbi:MAG: flagellar filament capping protein FliD [Longimicrobiales bacterium]